MADSIFERRENLKRIQRLSTRELHLEQINIDNTIDISDDGFSNIQIAADAAAESLPEATHFVYHPGQSSAESNQPCPPIFSSPAILIDGSNLSRIINAYHYTPGIAGIDGALKHGCLVKVLEAFVGRSGLFHRILILNGQSSGLEAFIQTKFIKRLSKTENFLPFTTDTCRITSTLEGTICDATTSQWVNLVKPYFYAPRCEYWVTVKTDSRGAGGSEEELESRKQEAIYLGIDALFEYYDKVRDEEFIDIYKYNAFDFAKATAWHIDPPPGGGLKVLVTVPAKYFDMIPQQTRNLNLYLEEKIRNHLISIRFNSSKIQEEINNIVFFLYEYENDSKWRDFIGHFSGPLGYGDFSFSYEAEKLNEFIPYLANLLRTNGYNLRRQNNDFIEIGFDQDLRISYVLLDQGEGNIPMTMGLNYFRQNDPASLTRTMGLLARSKIINKEIKTKRNTIPFEDFINEYVIPAPDRQIPSDSKRDDKPCIPDPLNPLKCCDFDLFSASGVKDHFGKIGKNTAAKFKDLANLGNLKKDFLKYQDAYRFAACGAAGPINIMSMIDSPRAPAGFDSINKLIDGVKGLSTDLDSLAKENDSIYESKTSPIKKASVKFIEDADIKAISPGLFECIKTEYEFVSDPALNNLIKRLAGKGAYGANGKFFSSEDYNPPSWEEMAQYVNDIEWKSIVKKALQCTCDVLEAQGDRAIAQLAEVEQLIDEANAAGRPVAGNLSSPDAWWPSNRPTIDSLKAGEKLEPLPPGARAGSYVRTYSSSPAQGRTSLANQDTKWPVPSGIVDAMGAPSGTELNFNITPSGVQLQNTGDEWHDLPPASAMASEFMIGGAVAGLDSVFGPGAGAMGAQFAHEAICQDLCKALPLLCSCIDLTFPDFELPRFTLEGIFGYLIGLLIDILIDILLNILLGLLAKMLDDLLRCEFDKSDPQVQDDFNNMLKNAVNFDVFGNPGSQEALSSGINSDPIDMDLMRPYLNDVPLVISPREFCQLIRGEASGRTLNTLEDLLESQHSGLRAYLRSQEQIRQLFIVIGRQLSDTTICDQLVQLADSARRTTIADHVCESAGLDEVRERLQAGDSSPDQIAELLQGVRLCRQQRLIAVGDFARELSSNPENFLKKLIPPVMGRPGQDSLIPRDPPELRTMIDKTIDIVFKPVAMAFDRDATSFPDSLVEEKYNFPSKEKIGSLTSGTLDPDDLSDSDKGVASFSNMIRNLVESSGGSALPAFDPSRLSQITLARPNFDAEGRLEKVVGAGLEEDLLDQDNFRYDPNLITGKIATAFSLRMSPFKTFAYDAIDLQFNEGDNILEYIPPAVDYPTNKDPETGQSPLEKAMGNEPVVARINVSYSLPLSSFCVEWDRQRDFYEIQLDSEVTSTALNLAGITEPDDDVLNVLSGPILTLVGEKKIKPEILNFINNMNYTPKGYASLQQEIYAKYMTNLWGRALGDPDHELAKEDSSLFNYYLQDSFNHLTEEFLQSMAETVGNSKYFNANNLSKLALKGDTACIPPKDSLVNIDKITTRVRELYYSDTTLVAHEERFGMSVFEGVVYTFIRVYMLEFILSGLFPFSRFRVKDVMDEAILKMAVKHLRDGLVREGAFPLKGKISGFKEMKEFIKNAGVGERSVIKNLSKWKGTFYEEFLRWCQLSILKRMEVGEQFYDKFLQKPVIIILDPITEQERISVKFQEELLPATEFYFALRNWSEVYNAYIFHLQTHLSPDGQLDESLDTLERRQEFPELMQRHDVLVDIARSSGWNPTVPIFGGDYVNLTGGNISSIRSMDMIHENTFAFLDDLRRRRIDHSRGEGYPPALDLGSILPVDLNPWFEQINDSYDCECLILSDDTASGQFSSWETDPETGYIKLGYLEFLAREQLFSVKDEVESYIGSEVEDINSLFLGNINPSFGHQFRAMNPSINDPTQRYFVRDIVDVPLDPINGETGRLPVELVDETTVLPFILEKYVKIVDYDKGWWDELNTIEHAFGENITLAQQRELYEQMAPQNRKLMQTNLNRVHSTEPSHVEVSLSPADGSRETILPIGVFFDWLAQVGYKDAEGKNQNPMWTVDETLIGSFDHRKMFEDIKFGLRLVLAEKQYTKDIWDQGELQDLLENAGDYRTAVEMIQNRDEVQESTFSMFNGIDAEIKERMTQQNKAFFLRETLYSTFDASGQLPDLGEALSSLRIPSVEYGIISLPIISMERAIEPNELSTAAKGYIGTDFQEIVFPRLPTLKTRQHPFSPDDMQWHSEQTDISGQNPKRTGNLDKLYALMYGIDQEYAAGSQLMAANKNNLCIDFAQISSRISPLLPYFEIESPDMRGLEDLSEAKAYYTLLEYYNQLVEDYTVGDAELADIIREVDGQIREIEQSLFTDDDSYFKQERPDGLRIDLNWVFPDDGANFPFGNTKFFRRELRNLLSRTAFGYPGQFNLRRVVDLELIMAAIRTRGDDLEFWTSTLCWGHLFQRLRFIFLRGPTGIQHYTWLMRWFEDYEDGTYFTREVPRPATPLDIPNSEMARRLVEKIPELWSTGGTSLDPEGWLTDTDLHRQERISVIQSYLDNDDIPGLGVYVGRFGVEWDTLLEAMEEIREPLLSTMTVVDHDRVHEFMTAAEEKIKEVIDLIQLDHDRRLKLGLEVIDQIQSTYRSKKDYYQFPELSADAERLFWGVNGQRGYHHDLLEAMIEDPEFSLLTEYIFPLKRFSSLISIYSTSKIAGLSLYRNIFADTKLHAKQLFVSMASSFVTDENGRPGWYRVDIPEMMRQGAFDPLPWWIKLLQTDLSFNLIGFLTFMPKKILQIILSVPWFSTIVDPLCSVLSGWPWTGKWTTCKDLLGNLPPNRKTDDDDDDNLPKRAGDGYNCGTLEQREAREKRQSEKMLLARPDSVSPRDDSDIPF